MATKKQHYVPRTYLKAWEKEVENSQQSGKKFNGVYVFKDGSNIGEGCTRESVLWNSNFYTINFMNKNVIRKCPLIKKEIVNEIARLMEEGFKKKVYAKYNYSIIQTTSSINKHFFDIEDWDFFYNDGEIAGKQKILNRFSTINSYILEEAFNKKYEEKWGTILNRFIDEVHNGKPYGYGVSERYIESNLAEDILRFFLMMLCRNPSFDALGTYTIIKEIMIKPITDLCGQDNFSISEDIIRETWLHELYRMFFSQSRGFYNSFLNKGLNELQLILFQTYDNAGEFITSDNPAFLHVSMVETNCLNGFYFPLSPKYLLLVVRGREGLNVVDYRYADSNTIRLFNYIVKQHSNRIIVGTDRHLNNLL